ncbi:uncharacterized protein LOC130656932 [Hydractinia symbiolongicarpus]|uniref:uncharacterized protein LOC130656932 n=1 Tax=Hydractinia symbiolongicarpus TaxID=13093 RepID=UPI00254AC615|nr:uncharacterized protein LOC130656932 [Hydractinia symbiolongicarpus]
MHVLQLRRLFFSVFLLRLCLVLFPVESVEKLLKDPWYISDKGGKDVANCGNSDRPCKSLRYTWRNFFPRKKDNSEVIFLLSPGYYHCNDKKHQWLECGYNGILYITIAANNSGSKPSDVTIVGHSFHTLYCNIKIKDVSFTGNSNFSLRDAAFITMRNCVFLNMKLLLHFQGSSNEEEILNLINVKIINTTSYQGRSLMEAYNKTYVSVQNMTIESNKGRGHEEIKFYAAKSLNITNLVMAHNIDFALQFSNINGTLQNITFVNNTILANPKKRSLINFKYSQILLKECKFSCNRKNLIEVYPSPVKYDNQSIIECTNCRSVKCPVTCDETGYGIYNGIFCQPCAPGTAVRRNERYCRKCEKGSYADQHKQTECFQCRRSSYCDKQG